MLLVLFNILADTSSGVDVPYYSGWTYIFVLALIVAFFDGYGIGANDVANSFATSVGSGSLTLKQAVMIGLVTEFTGALLLGKNTSSTIKNGILSLNNFTNAPNGIGPSLLMLAMFCAMIGSSTWVLLATYMGLPVSTSHSIVGSIIGVGIAAFGGTGINWGYQSPSGSPGFAGIVSSWFISPIAAGICASIIWLITERFILKAQNSFTIGLKFIPLYFGITFIILSFYMLYDGITAIDLGSILGLGGVFGVAIGCGILAAVLAYYLYVPFVRNRVEIMAAAQEDREIALRRGDSVRSNEPSASLLGGGNNAGDYHNFNIAGTTDQANGNGSNGNGIGNSEGANGHDVTDKSKVSDDQWARMSFFERAKFIALRGVNVDVVHHADLADMHARVPKYEDRTEMMYSLLQILTAAFASFAHGSNDIANAVGPMSTVYAVWSSNYQPSSVQSTQQIPIWVIAYCAVALDIGLATYGYNIMRELGNKITYHSPARGFSMELGSAFAVLTASKLGWPISTTQCITGATLAVGLCSGDANAVNWKRAIRYMLAWMVTLPCTGLVSGLIFAIVAYAPKAYQFET